MWQALPSIASLPSNASLSSPSMTSFGGSLAAPNKIQMLPIQSSASCGFPSASSGFRFTRSPSPGPRTAADAATSPVRVIGMSPFSGARSPRAGQYRSSEIRQSEALLGPQRSMTSVRAASPPPLLSYVSPRGVPLFRASSTSAPSGHTAASVPVLDLQRPPVDSNTQDSSEYSPRDSVWKRYFCNQEGQSSPPTWRPSARQPDSSAKLAVREALPPTSNNSYHSYASTASVASRSSLMIPIDSMQPILNIASRPDHVSPRDSSRTASPTSGMRSARLSMQQVERDSQTGDVSLSSLPSPVPVATAYTIPAAALPEEIPSTAVLPNGVSEEMLKMKQGQLGSSQASTCGGGTARTEPSSVDSWQGNGQRPSSVAGTQSSEIVPSSVVSEAPLPGSTTMVERGGVVSSNVADRGSVLTMPADLVANAMQQSNRSSMSDWEQSRPRSAQSSSPSTAPAPSSATNMVADTSTTPPPMERGGSHVPPVRSAVKTPSPAQLQQLTKTAQAITAEDLHNLRGLSRPHPAVREVIDTSLMLLGYRDTRWSAAQAYFAKPEEFLERLRTFDVCRNVSRLQFHKLRRTLDGPQFSSEDGHAESLCVACRGFVRWSRAVFDALSVQFGETRRLTSGRQRSRSPEAALRPPVEGVWPSAASTSSGNPVSSPTTAAETVSDGHSPAPRTSSTYRTEHQPEERTPYVRKKPDLGCLQVFPDIYSMTHSELQRVRNLTIRKADVGEVTYPCEIDLVKEHMILEDLPNIIRLDPGEVVLYPDSGTKPAEGEGLNRPAIITLFQCMPPNNGNFPDADSKARYRERIAKMTEQKGARFVDYDCDRGIWQFRVDHF